MRGARRTFKTITNKYLIALIAFVTIMLFFDDNNLFVQLDRKGQLNELLINKKYYEGKIKSTRQQLNDLQSNPEAIEKFVRENYGMKRDNEDVFVVEPTPEKTGDKK